MYRRLLRPLLFRLDAERAHSGAAALLRLAGSTRGVAGVARKRLGPGPDRGARLLGLDFPSRLGLAAGFDKAGNLTWGAWALGFGFMEVGSVTDGPWPGNPCPRVFRLPGDEAIINRMGLPSPGADAVVKALADRPPFPVLVNVAKTADPAITGEAALVDMASAVRKVAPVADAVVLNLSCPNTEDGRTFEDPVVFRELASVVVDAIGGRSPWLVKVSPDLDSKRLEGVVTAAVESGAAGVVAANTTVSREGLVNGDPGIRGGLSGRPLRKKALDTVSLVRSVLGAGPVVIGCGGVFRGSDMQELLDAGADLVEAYTGLVYVGPRFCRIVYDGLRRDGF